MFRGTVIGEWKRPRWAFIACGLWLLGFDVAPLAHIVFHRALDHHHHHHGQHHEHEGEDESPSEHGEGSVAHRDLAAQLPLASVPVVQEALLAWSALPNRPQYERPNDRKLRATKARGPPAQTA